MRWRNRYTNRGLWRPTYSLWRDLNRLQNDVDFLMGGTTGPRRQSYPAMNVWVGEQGITVRAEVPGVEPDDLDITVVGETVTLSGKRADKDVPENVRYHRRERGTGEFSRTLQLPYRVNSDAVEAKFQHGVLDIYLPIVPEEQPKKIEVKGA